MSASPSEGIHSSTDAETPRTILLLRPDAMGDLVLFSATLAAFRESWPAARIVVLIRNSHADLARLLLPSIEWITTSIDPFIQGPVEKGEELASVLATVSRLQASWVIAACSRRTWLDFAIARVCPDARRLALASGEVDRYFTGARDSSEEKSDERVFDEIVPIATDTPEWKRGFALVDCLAKGETPRREPSLTIPDSLAGKADAVLRELGFARGAFVACAAAGFSNVRIKTWPSERFARSAAWLDKDKNVPVLLVGHESEREYLENIKAKAGTGRVKLWLGRGDELPLLAALLAASCLYFGNDTGAMHLAAAAGIPVVGLFGGGTWPRFRSAARCSIDLVCPMPCFGCEWDCAFGNAPCVTAITEEAVREALAGMLQSAAVGNETMAVELPVAGLNALVEGASMRSRQMADQLRKRQSEFERTVQLAVCREQEIRIKEQEIHTKDREIHDLKAATDSKDSELTRQSDEMATLRAACQERLELIEHLDKTIKILVTERTALVNDVATVRQESIVARKEARDTEELYKQLSPDAAQWARQLSEANSKAAALQHQLDGAKAELCAIQGILKERETSLSNLAGGMGALEVHKYYHRLLRDKENVLQMLHRACQEREILIRKLAMEATSPTARLHKLLTGIRGFWEARISLPLHHRLEKHLLEGYWMQLGQLQQFEAKPIEWDRRLASHGRAPAQAPRIGIVTPSFNQAAFLEKTIRSITGQEYPDLKYVIQDGASKDGSVNVIGRHSPRLHAWESVKDSGQVDAIRRGFSKLADQLAPEDLMAWVNSDDLLAPGCLNFVGRYFAKHPEVDVIYGHRIIIDALDREIGRWAMPRHNRETLRWIDFVPQETLFWRKRIWDRIGGLDPSYQFALDWDFLLRIQDSGTKIVRVPYFLGAFRVHGESKTSSLIHTHGTQEMERVRQRVHGASFDHSRLDSEVKRAQFDGAITSRLLSLGIRH